MKETKKVITALDIGSSKILAVVAEIYKDGTFRVLAQGRTDSEGVRDGNVVSIEEAMPRYCRENAQSSGLHKHFRQVCRRKRFKRRDAFTRSYGQFNGHEKSPEYGPVCA